MSILGVGNDIIEIGRIQAVLKRFGEHFLNRIFTLKEQKYCLKYKTCERNFAGRFAAKEAFVKALGTGFVDISWLDIQILNNERGQPFIELSPKLEAKIQQAKIEPTRFHVSISHCQKYATAVVIWSQDPKLT